MPERRASLMEPRMEQLLDRVESKFTLVTLASKRAREINDYYNQLGEGLGKIVPPQVTSVSRKPLTISLEEIEAGKIEAVAIEEDEEGAAEAEEAPEASEATETAKLIGKYATGISDDLLTAALLATRAPVVLAPAMHTEMWDHPAVQENIATLRRRGVHLVPPDAGRLAGGDTGEGRLADPARIVAAAAEVLSRGGDLVGLRILVT